VDKTNRSLESDIAEATTRLIHCSKWLKNQPFCRIEDLTQALNDGEMNKKRLQTERSDLEKQIEEGENTTRALNKLKTSLGTQVIIILIKISNESIN